MDNDSHKKNASFDHENKFHIFNSFEEQETYELKLMASYTPEQILIQLRKLINTAYGMHGYDPSNLPKKHSIKIITGKIE